MMKRSLKFIVLLCCLAAVASGASSCKKNEEEKTKKYMSGHLKVAGISPFVLMDQDIECELSGSVHPEGKDMGLYVSISSVHPTADTLYYAKPVSQSQPGPLQNGFKVKWKYNFHTGNARTVVRDTLGTFTIYFSVYPVDSDIYYASSNSVAVTTVDELLSIPEIAIRDAGEVIDEDGYKYDAVTVGGKKWLSRNLATVSAGGFPYQNATAMNYIGGRFYTWDEAVHACPTGYTLPTNADWTALASTCSNVGDLLVDAHFNGSKMWEFWPDVKITGKSGIDMIPMGYANAVTRAFSAAGNYAAFWTADEAGTGKAVYRYVYARNNLLYEGTADKAGMAMNVRCVSE